MPGGSNSVNSDSSLFLDDPNADSLNSDLSIALVGPDDESRQALASVIADCQGGEVREYFSYPASLDDLPRMLDQNYGVIIIDLDSRPEFALELVESICSSKGSATVMVYSAKADSELLVRCMRAGAREFLTLPFVENTVAEALVRASARRPAIRPQKKASGRLLAFLGAKGGDGVTTLACNFAVSLAQESGQSTLLIDLDLPLGDAALNLGVVAEYSTINALQNASRLDSAFLSKLLVKHTTGVSVLAAPGKFPQFDAPNESIDKLITVARQEFENVVIDMGSRLDLMATGIFKEGSTVYLVIQAGIAGLRNSNRLISQYFSTDVPKLEIVLNRFQSRSLGVAEDQITKALTRPAQWKIPNDYAAVRRMQHTAVPLAMEDSPISRLIRQMARSACNLPPAQEKSSGFSLKKISRSITSKISAPEETPAFTQLDLSTNRESVSTPAPPSAQPEPPAMTLTKPADTSSVEPEPEPKPDTQPQLTAGADANSADAENAGEESAQIAAAPEKQTEPETRTYMGAIYVRGEDGRWHLHDAQAAEPEEEAPSAEAVKKETPVIEWSTPDPIVYGVTLGNEQLNAVAHVAGQFSYTPAAGEALSAGAHTLSATFTPEDTAAYASAELTVEITVNQATPIIAWSTPAQIAYGTPLSSAQLNAMASIPGEFKYRPGAGDVLKPGVQTLSVEFLPEDDANYTPAHASVSLTVAFATPAISWPSPAPIAYGTALGAAQLNATATVQGNFVYEPPAGEVLPAGEHTLSVAFTPNDTTGYRTAKAANALVVNKATPIIIWPAPAAISQGTALNAAQLNATALVSGTLIYTPGQDEVLPAGTHTLQVTFMPEDTLDYTAVQASVPITVTRSTPVFSWAASDPITFGKGSATTQFNVESESAAAQAASVPAGAAAFQSKPEPPIKVAPRVPVKPAARATAKPVVKTPARAHVKIAEEPETKEPAKTRVKVAEDSVRNVTARPHVKLAAKLPAQAPPSDSDETASNALVKVGGAPKVPIDIGPGLDLMGSAVLEDGTTIYLVMQPGSAGLVNSSRLVSQLFSARGPKPGFVINRFEPHSSETAEESSAASGLREQKAQPDGEEQARSDKPEKKTGFSLKGFGRSIWSKLATPERVPSMTRLGLAANPDDGGAPLAAPGPDTMVRPTERPIYSHPDAALFTPAERAPFAPAESSQRPHDASAPHQAMHAMGTPGRQEEPKTRIYRGATYVKGEDGQWHLQVSEAKATHHETKVIPLPASTPIASATRLNAGSRAASADIVTAPAKKPAHKGKPAPKKAQAKAHAAKKLVKPAAKTSSKQPIKPAGRPAMKSSAKQPVKASVKPAAKHPAKLAGKATQKPAVKSPAKKPVKAAAKPQVKTAVRKAPPVKKKAVIATTPRPARKASPTRLAADRQVIEPEMKAPPQEPILIAQAPELVKES